MSLARGPHRVLDGKVRNGVSLAALGAAAVVCMQVGFVRIAAQRSDALEQRLETERFDRGREVAKLHDRLDRAEGQVLQLRRNLSRSQRENATLADSLQEADTATELLRTRVVSLSETLKEERPSLDVHLEPSGTPDVLAAVAENRGSQPVEIREAYGWLWVADLPLPLAGSLGPATLGPGGEIDLFEYDPASENLEFVADSTEPVRGSLCFTYQRDVEDGSAPWAEQHWFEYRPGLGSTATLRRDSWLPPAGEPACELGTVEPPW